MKFAILGAGGIGCYYAARLIDAGHKCVLVARGEHLRAMQLHGLTVEHPEFTFNAPVTAVDLNELCRDHTCDSFDLLILASKGSTTLPMMTQMQDWLSRGNVPVLSIQNGVTNESIIEDTIGRRRTIGGLAVKIGAHITSPGRVVTTGIAQIDFGAWPSAAANPSLQPFLVSLASQLTAAAIPNTLYDDVSYALWRKLLINNGVNPLTALTLKDTGVITKDPVLRRTVYKMMEETARAANVAGVALSKADVDEMFRLICEFDAIKTSMQVDREKGRPMEIREICGPVIDYCRKTGKPAETTELISHLLLNASG